MIRHLAAASAFSLVLIGGLSAATGGSDQSTATVAAVRPATAAPATVTTASGRAVAALAAAPADLFAPVSPARLLDTRKGAYSIDSQFVGSGITTPGGTLALQVTGRGGVPAGAGAAVLNVTAAEATGPGYLTVYPCGEAVPGSSSLNYSLNRDVANAVLTKLSADGKVCIRTGVNNTQVVADVTGYFPPGSSFTPLSPARILDTRPGTSTIDKQAVGSGLTPASSTLQLLVSGRGGVPATAGAVVLNVTAADATGAGYLTVYPCGEPVPGSSSLNFSLNRDVANAVLTKIGSGGKVCIRTGINATHIVADVTGYLDTGAAPPLPTGPGTSASCRFLTTSTTAAMCDSFDEAEKDPATRTGDLNATLWGVSRIGSFKDNTFYPATLTGCGATQKVLPPNDVRICNGRLFDASMDLSPEDDGGQIGLAMYPKQPFDIAGRTGTVVFDVSADANSVHSAWPEFWWTDQPVPAPHGHLTTAAPYARNSFGFAVAQACGSNGTTVSAMQVTRNYAFDDLPFTTVGCIAKGSATGQLNHFEVKINQNRVEVWATNPGASDIQLLAYADNTNITMTRGLIWIEDVHYNACKFATDMQCDHQLGWDNVGFDGPTPYRDLSFDVPDGKTTNPNGVQLGYTAGPTPLAVKTVPVYRLQTPTSALVTLNWWPYNQFVPSIRINGGPWHDTAWPFDSETFTWRTIAIPVPASETIDGPNTIEIKAGENVLVANINLILIAASPVP